MVCDQGRRHLKYAALILNYDGHPAWFREISGLVDHDQLQCPCAIPQCTRIKIAENAVDNWTVAAGQITIVLIGIGSWSVFNLVVLEFVVRCRANNRHATADHLVIAGSQEERAIVWT
jgi:hypothetical protein